MSLALHFPKRPQLGALSWGGAALLFMLAATILAFAALMGWSAGEPDFSILRDAYFHRILRFTFWQAFLSTLLAVGLALPIARAVALDSNLPGRALLLRWSLLCFVMPTLILITGMVVVFGRSGWLTPYLGSGWNLYGLNGILLAHVFLNLPFALRVLVFQWQSIPDTAWKVSAQLGLRGWQRFVLVEWPMLRGALPAVSGFIFLLCFNSFAIVLALGGGPRATTIEVAIYQALKFAFNPAEALTLAWTQLVIAGSLFLVMSRLGKLAWLSPPQGQSWQPRLHPLTLWLGRVGILMTALFLTVPILTLVPLAVAGGLQALSWQLLWPVTLRSLGFAVAAATLAVALALGSLELWRLKPRWRTWVEISALHHLVIPGMVLSVGLYLFFLPHLNWLQWGWVAIIGLNALVALPFVYHQLKPKVFEFDANYRRQVAALGLSGWAFWRQVYGPWLRVTLRRAWALAFVLALGDFAIFGIFGQDEWRTLPWLIHALAGSYQLRAAALASLWLLAFALLALWLLEEHRSRA